MLLEINKTTDENKRQKLLKVIDDYPFIILEAEKDQRILLLSDLYIKGKTIPKKKIEDAMHMAVCTVFELDILLSWNFKHLSNIRMETLINAINEKEGYWKKLNLMSPLEALYED